MDLKQTHFQFWIWIPVVLILGFIFTSEINLIVYIDQYNFKLMDLAIPISVVLFVSGIGYFMNRKKEMNPKLTKVHKNYTLAGVGLCSFIGIFLYFKNKDLSEVPDIKTLDTFTLDQTLALFFMLGVFILFLGFLVYIVNTAITTFFSEVD